MQMHWELEGTDPARLAVTPEKERGVSKVLAGKGSVGVGGVSEHTGEVKLCTQHRGNPGPQG